MPTPQDEITVRFPLLGFETQQVKRYRLSSDYTTITDGWSLDVWARDPDRFRGVELQPIEILINGCSQVLGRVDLVRRGDNNGTTVTLEGRDYLADMVECHVDPTLKIQKDMTLEAALLLAAGPVGITEVLDDQAVSLRNVRTGATTSGPAPDIFRTVKVESLKPNPGQGLAAWCADLAKRHGATVQPGVKRSQMVLSAPHYGQSPRARVLRRRSNPGAAANNVISASATADLSSFPTHVLVAGQSGRKGGQKAAQGFELDLDWPGPREAAERFYKGRLKPADGAKPETDTLYRLHYIRDDQAKNGAQLQRVQIRRMAELLKDSLQYSVTFRGHSDPESRAVYGVDTLIEVDDDVCDVHEPMWVASRSFSYTDGQGPTTQLTCWRLGTFVL